MFGNPNWTCMILKLVNQQILETKEVEMIGKTNLERRLLEEIKKGSDVILIKVNPSNYFETFEKLFRFLTAMGKVVYVSLNKPCSSLRKHLSRIGADTDNIVFIDAVTKQFSASISGDNNCIYVESPNPVQLTVSIERAMEKINSEIKFLYIDSLSTISLYKSNDSLIKFLRQLTGKIRFRGFVAVIVVLDSELDPVYFAQASLMCDAIVEVV